MPTTPTNDGDLKVKIARLVEERGWNQDEFARRAELNRHTVRDILGQGERKLRNATVSACARAFGLTVSELRDMPLSRLFRQAKAESTSLRARPSEVDTRRLCEEATQPELRAWMERNPDRAGKLSSEDIDELLSLQGTGGPLTSFGVEHFVELIERRRSLVDKVHAIAGTEYLALLEQLVDLLFEKIQPYAKE
jgi:transcriptional regulator with XRE-family HTH domain